MCATGIDAADPVEVPVFPPEGGLQHSVELRDGDGFRELQPAPDLGFGALDADAQVEARDGVG
jgi:hypothetical protein